jgi:hypothetical protein
MHLDYTNQGRRPSAAQIVAAWKKAGKPILFSVSYGETFAEFEYTPGHNDAWWSGWHASGNGCRGVDRDAVTKALPRSF